MPKTLDARHTTPYCWTKGKEAEGAGFMTEATLTSKGQITIPAEIRRQMKLSPQDRVVFTVLPNGTTVMRAKNKPITSLAASIKPSVKRVATKDLKMD